VTDAAPVADFGPLCLCGHYGGPTYHDVYGDNVCRLARSGDCGCTGYIPADDGTVSIREQLARAIYAPHGDYDQLDARGRETWLHIAERLVPTVARIARSRAHTERIRTLTDARALVARLTAATYPVRVAGEEPEPAGASVACSEIRRAFDQWVIAEYGTLADPDRRLCPVCDGQHTPGEYDDAHLDDEGDHR
jgi:hypothetical protein